MKKWLALLLGCVLALNLSAACALGISNEEFDLWYEEMRLLVEDIGTRAMNMEEEGLELARVHLTEYFEQYGYSFEEETLQEYYISLEDGGYDNAVTLVAIKPALNPDPQIITLCAHYDSLQPGARDNASGVASLQLMMHLLRNTTYEDTEIRFIAFTAEETGHQGSLDYCGWLTQDELERSLAAFNVDILVKDTWEDSMALCIDTLGMRTAEGYVSGTEKAPAYNRPALALLAAMEELGFYPMEDEDVTWCLPRHFGQSDHESFHAVGVDSVNFCFHGTRASGGAWPEYMHTFNDVMGDFDLEASWNALEVLYTAVDSLARNHTYGDSMK